MPRNRPSLLSTAGLSLALGATLSLGACDSKEKEQLKRTLDETSNKLLDCKKQNNELTNQVSSLKRQVAQAVANPTRITLTDPEIIELVASIRGGSGNEVDSGPGPDPKEISKIVMTNAPGLQQCYERALKKNAGLQQRAGVQLVLGLNLRPAGGVDSVSVQPSIDAGLTECIKSAAGRWKFPAFQGKPVLVEQKVVLTPKT